MKAKNLAAFWGILAAALYAVNIPLSKLLLTHVDQMMMAGFLYLGAGLGMLLLESVRGLLGHGQKKERLTRKELPYTVGMVLLDIAAPILLMYGITKTNSANVSLLNNFEIVATSLIALLIFREVISRKLWTAIGLVTLASVILSFEGEGSFSFHSGSLLVLGACVCWGFENNCTRMISNKSSEEIVVIKGCFSGLGSLALASLTKESLPRPTWILPVLLLGFVSYGLSINFYIMAQKELGAAKTSAYYSIAPFLGAGFGLLLLGERPAPSFYGAMAIMVSAALIIAGDSVELQHSHPHVHVHTHVHSHGNLVHSHQHEHSHSHLHTHGENPENHSHPHGQLPDHNHLHSPGI